VNPIGRLFVLSLIAFSACSQTTPGKTATSVVQTGKIEQPKYQQWEYKVERFYAADTRNTWSFFTAADLNQLGKDGWELVSTVSGPFGSFMELVYKRPLRDSIKAVP